MAGKPNKQWKVTMLERFGSLEALTEHMKSIGAKGGKLGRTGGFAYSKAHGLTTHIEAGRKGGKNSRRAKKDE